MTYKTAIYVIGEAAVSSVAAGNAYCKEEYEARIGKTRSGEVNLKKKSSDEYYFKFWSFVFSSRLSVLPSMLILWSGLPVLNNEF